MLRTLPSRSRPLVRQFWDMAAHPVATVVAISAPFAVGWLASRYKVSESDQYLVRTGLGIADLNIRKTAILWPFQKSRFLNIAPKNYSFNLQAMSSEKMEFVLPGVFTIGPKTDYESLEKFSKMLLSRAELPATEPGHDHLAASDSLDAIIKGILEGEVRIRSAGASQTRIKESANLT